MKKLIYGLLTVLMFCLVSRAEANLITNGSFESPAIPSGTWQWFSSEHVSGWQGSNVEIWHSLFGFDAFHGQQYIELNAHPFLNDVFSIFQSFVTQVGQEYEVSFAYSARQHISEAFRFSLYSSGGLGVEQIIADHSVRQWQVFNTRFTADHVMTTLSFTSVKPLIATVGNLIDDVNVRAVINVGGVKKSNPEAFSVDEPMSFGIVMFLYLLLLRKQLK